MLKWILIYLWIYIGLFYMIEAGEDEHVHIKLHMTSGQRKRAQILQHHKKRHSQPPSHSASHHSHRSQPLPPPPPPPPPTTTNIYHESPHDYLTSTSSSSSSLLEPQQHVFSRIKKHPSSSPSAALLQLHENGQLLNMDEDIYDQGDMGDSTVIYGTNTDNGEHMMIPSYMAKDFALFPQPTTTYETEITPHNFKGFNAVEQSSFDGLGEFEEDNEIPKHTGKRGAIGNLESLILAEQMENYHRHKPTTYPSTTSTSSKIIKNEQLFQQLLQQQQQQHHNNNEKPEIMNAAAYKSTKQRGHKYRAENDYHSEDDMTETMMYSSKHKPTTIHTSNQDDEEEVVYSGGIKTLTVDDIWSQLQQQYLNKFSPQAQASTSLESEEQSTSYTKPKHKRNTKRQRYAKPTIATYPSNSWPVKTLSFVGSSKHQKHQLKQPQYHYNDEIHSLPSAAAFSSSGQLTAHRDKDLFGKRPFNKFTAHDDDDDTAEIDDDVEEHDEQDEVDVYGDNADNNHDESFEDAIYQSGKKLSSHSAHGQQRHANNLFNYHDLYGSYSTPVTATIATHIQPSTYHPNLGSSSTTLPTYTGTSTSSFLTSVSQHPSTSYQWRTQQNYPASYQTYHLQHQQQQPQWTTATTSATAATEGTGIGRGSGDEHIVHLSNQHTNPALRLPKATISQTPNTSNSYSKLSPTQSSNDFTVTTSSLSSLTSSSAKSTVQPPPARYKKRKNRIKTKRNRIVVI